MRIKPERIHHAHNAPAGFRNRSIADEESLPDHISLLRFVRLQKASTLRFDERKSSAIK